MPNLHTQPVLDLSWRDEDTFVTASVDRTMHLCQIGRPNPIITFRVRTDGLGATLKR
jgi:hypothetical protein